MKRVKEEGKKNLYKLIGEAQCKIHEIEKEAERIGCNVSYKSRAGQWLKECSELLPVIRECFIYD
jgi:hypothetical protein